MKQFIAKFADQVDGVLSGWDRLMFRGELCTLYNPGDGGMKQYLKSSKILLKDFGEHVRQVSGRLKKASLAPILKMGRMVQYLAPSVDKSAVAHKIAAEQNIGSGLCLGGAKVLSFGWDVCKHKNAGAGCSGVFALS